MTLDDALTPDAAADTTLATAEPEQDDYPTGPLASATRIRL